MKPCKLQRQLVFFAFNERVVELKFCLSFCYFNLLIFLSFLFFLETSFDKKHLEQLLVFNEQSVKESQSLVESLILTIEVYWKSICVLYF